MYRNIMKQYDAIKMGGTLFRYDGIIHQTEQLKILLCFYDGSENWLGMYPGCSFDQYYDKVMVELGPDEINPRILKQRQSIPTMVFPFKDVGICQNPSCDNRTEYKYCSLTCWYTFSIETNQNAIDTSDNEPERIDAMNFRQKLIQRYGWVA